MLLVIFLHISLLTCANKACGGSIVDHPHQLLSSTGSWSDDIFHLISFTCEQWNWKTFMLRSRQVTSICHKNRSSKIQVRYIPLGELDQP